MTEITGSEKSHLLEIVFPNNANSQGTLFGGHALSLMDRLAFIVASRYSRLPVVTASSDEIAFHSAVRVGQLIELIGHVASVGRTSMRVEIEMFAEDLLTGERNLCTTGEFVMVAVGADGRPTPVPQ